MQTQGKQTHCNPTAFASRQQTKLYAFHERAKVRASPVFANPSPRVLGKYHQQKRKPELGRLHESHLGSDSWSDETVFNVECLLYLNSRNIVNTIFKMSKTTTAADRCYNKYNRLQQSTQDRDIVVLGIPK